MGDTCGLGEGTHHACECVLRRTAELEADLDAALERERIAAQAVADECQRANENEVRAERAEERAKDSAADASRLERELAEAREAVEAARRDGEERYVERHGSCPHKRARMAAEVRAERAEKSLLDVHDALHRECDGSADLPAEIRDLRARAETLTKERDEARSWHLAARERYAAAEADAARLRAGMRRLLYVYDRPAMPDYDAALSGAIATARALASPSAAPSDAAQEPAP